VGRATLAAVLGLFGSLGAGDASGLDATLRFFEGTNKGVDGLELLGPSNTLESATTTIACDSRRKQVATKHTKYDGPRLQVLLTNSPWNVTGFGQIYGLTVISVLVKSLSFNLRVSITVSPQLRQPKMTALRYEMPSHLLIQDPNHLQANSKGALPLFRKDAMNLTFLDDF
jgi:hypothetical protein